MDVLQGIWKHYHYSPKAVRELEELAESMQVTASKAVRADGTRWESHLTLPEIWVKMADARAH